MSFPSLFCRATELRLKRPRVLRITKAIDRVPTVVFEHRPGVHLRVDLLVKDDHRIKVLPADILGRHENLMRVFAVDHAPRRLASCARHVQAKFNT